MILLYSIFEWPPKGIYYYLANPVAGKRHRVRLEVYSEVRMPGITQHGQMEHAGLRIWSPMVALAHRDTCRN
jgi:hypothetical protein